jgi:hypothetical protein
MTLNRAIWDVTRNPEGPAFAWLLRKMTELGAETFRFAVGPQDVVTGEFSAAIQSLSRFESSREWSRNWVGTHADEKHQIFSYSVSQESIAAILALSKGIFDWDGASLPLDLHFLRGDGSAVLGSIASEYLAWFEFDESELEVLGSGLRRTLGLQPPEVIPKTHLVPAWEERADSVIVAALVGVVGEWELLPCESGPDGIATICCIPFADTGLALGDVVSTIANGQGFHVDGVLSRSGRSVIRVQLAPIFHSHAELITALQHHRLVLEWSGGDLIVIDAANEVEAERVVELLALATNEFSTLSYWID